MQRRTGRAVFDLGGVIVMVGLDVVQRAALKYVECAKSAARRAIGAVSPERLPDSPNREQLAGLWRDMLDKS